MGTEWGLGPFTIEQTTEDVTATRHLAVSRLRGRRLLRHRPAGSATSGDPRQSRRHDHERQPGPAIRTAPNPGTS